MRVVFLGTPEFAVPSLEALLKSKYEVCSVYSQPDRPAGRGHRVAPTPVKQTALSHGVPVHQPDRIRAEDCRPAFELLRPDFVVVVAYGQILPKWLLDAAAIAPVNVHGSLLPAYRGAAPVNWAVLNGEQRSGVTTMLMAEALDAGPLLLRQEVPIAADMTAGDLYGELATVGASLLVPTLDGLAAGTLKPTPQDEHLVSWAPRIRKEMGRIDWHRTAAEIHNLVRGLNPWPLAYATLGGLRFQVVRTAASQVRSPQGPEPGTFLGVRGAGMMVQCGDGTVLELTQVQPANRKRMSGRELVAGFRLSPGTLLESPPPGPVG
jgi:methionyl-tRNA formyltransferase